MKVISQKEIDREIEYLEKQKNIINAEREKIMIERSRLYYEWKEIQETEDSIAMDRERVDTLRKNLGDELAKIHKEYEELTQLEIEKIKKEKVEGLEKELEKERKRVSKLRKEIVDDLNKYNEKIRKEKEKELEDSLSEDRKRLDGIRRDLHELIAIENTKIEEKKITLKLI